MPPFPGHVKHSKTGQLTMHQLIWTHLNWSANGNCCQKMFKKKVWSTICTSDLLPLSWASPLASFPKRSPLSMEKDSFGSI